MSLMDANRAKDRVLEAIADGSSLKEACRAAGVSCAAHYSWKSADPAYLAAWEFAKSIRADRAEEEIERRGIDGYDEVTTYEKSDGTVERKTVRKYDGTLLLAYVKAAKPEKYSDKFKHEISGEVSVAETIQNARKRLAQSRGETDGE